MSGYTIRSRTVQKYSDEFKLKHLGAHYAVHDTTSARQPISDDFFMTTSNGRVKDRTMERGDIRAQPGLTMQYFRTEDVPAREYGTAGVVTGTASWAFEMGGQASLQPGVDHSFQRTIFEILTKVLPRATGLGIVVMPADPVEGQIKFPDRPRHEIRDRH